MHEEGITKNMAASFLLIWTLLQSGSFERWNTARIVAAYSSLLIFNGVDIACTLSVEMSDLCDEDQGSVPLALTWILLSLATITVALRLYVRLSLHRHISPDDYTALASLVSCLSSQMNSYAGA